MEVTNHAPTRTLLRQSITVISAIERRKVVERERIRDKEEVDRERERNYFLNHSTD